MLTVAELIKDAIDQAWDTSVPVYVKVGNNYHEVLEVYHSDESGDDELVVEVDTNPIETEE